MTPAPYTCPACGYRTFREPPGSYDLCSVCGWEDDALQLEYATSLAGGANPMTLAQAQEAFQRADARLERKHHGARVPRERDPNWRRIDRERDRFPEWKGDEFSERPSSYDPAVLYYWLPTSWSASREWS